MKLLRSTGRALSIALILGLLAFAVPAGAQTLTALSMERVLAGSLSHSSLGPPNFPASVLASILSGALEVHEQTNFNPQGSTLTSVFFIMPAGSTPPTSLASVPNSSIVAILALTADRVYVTSSAVQFSGTISQSNTPLYGTASYLGAPAVVSFGYTSDKPPKIHDVVESVAGAAVAYTASATGTFTITLPPSSGGPGGPGTGVTIVVNGPGASSTPNTFESQVNQLTLDASKSTSTNAGALTFAWAPAPGYPSLGITGGNTATPIIQLSSGRNTYQVILTVTDATGLAATATITLIYP